MANAADIAPMVAWAWRHGHDVHTPIQARSSGIRLRSVQGQILLSDELRYAADAMGNLVRMKKQYV
jgi:hypothetical protein